jgi:hypothetical protein
MTRPTHVFVWMIPFLVLVGVTIVLLYDPLSEAFLSNPVFNGIILAVLLVGIAINFRHVGMLSAEVAWINHYRGKRKRFWQSQPEEPRLLAPLAKMLGQQESDFLSLSPLPLRSVLDSVRLRLDELRDVSRYMIGLLIFLGLLGTFWGLLITVSGVGKMIGDLGGGAENALVFGSLLEGLKAPLSGMGTAFSSSLFGLAGSLVVGFLDLQAGHAQNRFFNELEDWLTGVTRMTGAQMIGERELSEPSYIHAMLEQTAETLDKLHRNVMRDDAQRRLIGDQIQGLGRELAAFADLSRDERRVLGALAKDQNELAPALKSLVERQGEVDESMHEHIRNLDSNIKRLVDEVVNGREQLVDEIRDELRVIGRALTAESHARSRSHKQKAG